MPLDNEVLSPEGLRVDGRRPGEVRRLRCQLSAEPKADGSAYLEQGNTKVLVTVTGPHEVSSQRKAQHDRAVLQFVTRGVRCDETLPAYTPPPEPKRTWGPIDGGKAYGWIEEKGTSGGAGGWKALAPPTSARAPTATRRLLAQEQSVHEAMLQAPGESSG